MADRYWVGGTGSWTSANTANWSATSGGGGGASVPTAADSVFFNAASAAGNYVVTLTGILNCLDLNIAKATAGTLTSTGAGGVLVAGNIVANGTGVTWGHTGTMSLSATTAKTITSGGLTFSSAITFTGVGGTWQLQDDLTVASTSTTSLTNGTLDLNNFVLSTGLFASPIGTKTLAFGTGSITLTGNNGTIWNISTAPTITGTPVVNCTYSGATGTRNIIIGTIAEAQSPTFNITAGTDIVAVAGSVKDLNYTGFSGLVSGGNRTVYGNLTIPATATASATSTITTFAATSGTKTIATGNLLLPFPITFSGGNTTVWQMQDNFIVGNATTHNLILTAGGLDFNNRAANIFVLTTNNTNLRSISNIAGNTMNITGTGTTVLNLGVTTNLTWPQGYTINFVGNGAAGTARSTSWGVFQENANPYAPNILVSAGSDNLTAGGTFRDLDFTGFSGNLLVSSRTLYGNLTISSGMAVVANIILATNFSATSGVKTITTNGKTIPLNLNFTGIGGTYQLQDDLNMSDGVFPTSLGLTGGTLNLNNKTATANIFSGSGSSTRNINFGTSGVMNLVGQGGTIWSSTIAIGFSYSGNARVNLTYAGATGTRTLVHGTTGGSDATKAPPIYFATGATDIVATTTNSYWSDLIFADGANVTLTNTNKFIYGNLTFSPGINLTAGASSILFAGNGVQTFDSANVTFDFPIVIGTGASNGNLRLANTTTTGNTRTTTLSSGTLDLNGQTLTIGSFTSSSTNTRAIYQNGGIFNVAGSNTSVWNMNTSTGFSTPSRPTVNFTYAGNVSSRSITGVIGGGTYNNSINFNFVSGSDIVGVGTCNANDLNFAGFTGTLLNTARSLYGNLTLGAGMTATAGANATTFNGTTGNQTLVTNGVATDFPITIFSTGGNFVLSEPLEIGATRVLTVTSGNLLTNNYDITTGQFSSTNLNTRLINISNTTVTLSGIDTVWNMTAAGGATLITTNSNITLSNTSTNSRTFAGGSLTYGNLDIGGATGVSISTITGNNTFIGALTSSKTVAHTIKFADTSTQTMGAFTVSGSLGALAEITSQTTTPHNLVLTGGGNVSTVDYLYISYSNASPATDTWYAGAHSTNAGNNTGWIFTIEPTNSGNFFLVF